MRHKFPSRPGFARLRARRTLRGLLVALLLALPASSHAGGGWEYVKTDKGVKVHRKPIEGSKLVAFRGETTADIHISKLVAVFKDGRDRGAWVDRYAGHETYKKSQHSETYWIRFDMPWPIADRDYVLKSNGVVSDAKQTYTVNIESVTHPAKGKDDCCVRALAIRTFYKFTALPGDKTQVVVEVQTDPKGKIPAWLVNAVQKSWPVKTLSGLIAHAKKSDRQPLAEFASWHGAG